MNDSNFSGNIPQDRLGDDAKTEEDFNNLSRQLLRDANRGILRVDYIRSISESLIEFSGCDTVEFRLKERERYYRARVSLEGGPNMQYNVGRDFFERPAESLPGSDSSRDLDELCLAVIKGFVTPAGPNFTPRGSFITGDASAPIKIQISPAAGGGEKYLTLGAEYRSYLIIPFSMDIERGSLLILKSRKGDFFKRGEAALYESVAQNIGIALVHRYAQIALRERVKELTCLYGIAKIASQPNLALDDIMQSIVELLPPAWLYPEIATARIAVEGEEYLAPGYSNGVNRMTSDIIVNNVKKGVVEVIYKQDRPPMDEGPFLREERTLIDTIAREIALILERRQAEKEKDRLQEQLRHADRLATIGQLAAGVAHELNEPLGNILGFAQLAGKVPDIPPELGRDLQKIVSASLHAREIIRKLMVFARQMPPMKTEVNLNQLVEDGIYFLESRCVKAGIELIRKLDPDLPEIIADPSQLHQVLVNLIVNSIQAMPNGGKIIIETKTIDGNILLAVEDTGVGISGDVLKKIFVPFFTTKDVHEGTGLGLSVVHGIVTGHGGSIRVESKVGVGTRFEIQLPVSALGSSKEEKIRVENER
jgi:signal transduction histidine kinase